MLFRSEIRQRNQLVFITLRDADSEMSIPVVTAPSLVQGIDRGNRVAALLGTEWWTRNGQVQFRAHAIQPVGVGELLIRLEKLRALLTAEGLFAPERKRPLPVLPNCIGLIDVVSRMPLTVNATLSGELLPAGRTAVVSQSGSMLGTLLSRGQARGLRFSRMVSVGNEADLGVGELTAMLVEDAHTDVILLFLETLRDAPRLAAAARRAHALGKAIVAYKLGRSSLGASLTVSHTGAIEIGRAHV
mgnify:CR=1 FL=1